MRLLEARLREVHEELDKVVHYDELHDELLLIHDENYIIWY